MGACVCVCEEERPFAQELSAASAISDLIADEDVCSERQHVDLALAIGHQRSVYVTEPNNWWTDARKRAWITACLC